MSDKAANISADATTKQINALNKTCSSLCSQIQSRREEHRNEEGQLGVATGALLYGC